MIHHPALPSTVSLLASDQHCQFPMVGEVTTLQFSAKQRLAGVRIDTSIWQQPDCIQVRAHPTDPTLLQVWDGISADTTQPASNPRTVFDLEFSTPLQLHGVWIEVQQQSADLSARVLRRPRRVGRRAEEPDRQATSGSPSSETLRLWLEALGALQRHPSNSQELLDGVANAMVNPGGLDAAMILVRVQPNNLASSTTTDAAADADIPNNQLESWRIAASRVDDPSIGFSYQQAIVDRVVAEGSAVVAQHSPHRSQSNVMAVPFFDEQQVVVGVLIGIRAKTQNNRRSEFRPAELQWVQVLAETATSSCIRFAIERKAARDQLIFGRSFSPAIMRAMQENPEILTPRETKVSILFADLRKFTRVGARLGSRLTCELLTDVMNELTAEVMRKDGVILDYYGDGLVGMWNAPSEQLDHASRACHTAMAMQKRMAPINEKWASLIGEPLKLAIGVATGLALVGNAGSDLRTKYGPRGTTVNLASRLESAAKKLNVPILINRETRRELPLENMRTRRVCRTLLQGISSACEIYELHAIDEPEDLAQVISLYEEALDLYENGRNTEACNILQDLNRRGRELGGLLALTKQAKLRRDTPRIAREQTDTALLLLP